MNQRYALCIVLIALAVLPLACGKKEEPAAPTSAAPASVAAPEPPVSIAALNRGAGLYQEHCAQCHGPEAQGHPDWQTPGVTAAPPLDGTGNDWKRSRAELVAAIRNGVKRDGAQVMPSWNGRLSDNEIDDIIAWFQALWPPEVYSQWRRKQATPKG
ncbi:cytochrome C [Sulfurifustis variabilis]|uniref:Cytochrome C n=1 Tax=Sulfurifustis variabilis TaxID=1675686 RepID=A0A1B4VBR4_9GAMM|nr:cytochrome c [Sulfurifustis variabilis]BAU49974.1 cytochrome C [Sulfurifustis variabilis]